MAGGRGREYWRQRAAGRERQAHRRGAAMTLRLFEAYKRAAREIQRETESFYARYAGKHGLTYAQAVRRLNRREFQEWKDTLGGYAERVAREQNPQMKKRLLEKLDALSANSQISRLQALQGQIDFLLNGLFDQGAAQLREAFGENFQESYYHKAYDLQARAGFYREFAKINEKTVEDALDYPWSGASFSQRLWQNRRALLFHLQETLTQGLILGRSPAAMGKELAARMGQSFKVAERLIRTETNYLHNEGEKAAYKAAGVEEYEFMATLDKRTCAQCGALDGKHFKLSQAKAGENFPPLHPNDRCTTIEYGPEDALDWLNSGEAMPENMTYEQWAARQGVSPSGGGREGKKGVENVEKDGIMGEKAPVLLGAGAAPSLAEIFREKDLMRRSEMVHAYLASLGLRESKWSGVTRIVNNLDMYDALGATAVNGDIILMEGADASVMVHEHLHARSAAYYPPAEVDKWRTIEEATVQLFTQELFKAEGLPYLESDYDEWVEILRKLNQTFKINESHYDFAKALFDIPMPNRWEFLNTKLENFLRKNEKIELEEAEKLREWVDFFVSGMQ